MFSKHRNASKVLILGLFAAAISGCATDDDYDGCHGIGCTVDDPSAEDRTIDDRPQFDKEGNPNFDTHGRYIGCRGQGCEVDDPDDSN